jgi:putative ABC transport system ATP-binding protein
MCNICELVGVRKNYGYHVVLDNMNLSVGEGEMVAITGKSGAGKTTILNIMGLLEKPSGGEVRLFGQTAPRIGSRAANLLLRTRLAYLFQNCALIDDANVDYNLEIPLIYAKKSRKEKKAMKQTALEKVRLDIPLKQKIYELSGGEQQRVAIARILLKPSELILADEPTGSLDDENRDEIMRILKELNLSGRTIIIVTHDIDVAGLCDRTIELHSKTIGLDTPQSLVI